MARGCSATDILTSHVAFCSLLLLFCGVTTSSTNPPCSLEDGACPAASVEDVEEAELQSLRLQLLQQRRLDLNSSDHRSAAPGSCKQQGCVPYAKELPCQCNSDCGRYHNCCSDYRAECLSGPNGALPLGHPKNGTEYPQYEGFTLWLVEEFDEPLDLDHDPIWTWSDGGLTEGKVRFVKDAVKFEDGKMLLEAKIPTTRQDMQACSHAEKGWVTRKSLTSGEMRTRYNMFRYGRYEARLKAPSVQPGNSHVNGNYISTLFVFRDSKIRHWREIDVEVTGDSPDAFTTNVLYADHAASWSPSIAKSQHHTIPGTNLREDFHIFAFEWLPDRITWYLDGKVVREHRGGQRPRIPDMSAKMITNLWIFEGPHFGGTQGHNNQYPLRAEYDWVRFYAWDGDTHYPCASLDSACLTSDDRYLAGNNPCDGITQEGRMFGLKPCSAQCK